MSSEQQGRNETRPNFPHDFEPWHRVGKLREFARLGTNSPDPVLRTIGHRLLEALEDGDPKAFFDACGITGQGGNHNTREIMLSHMRNRFLAQLYARHPEFRDLAPLDAARTMINSFAAYEVRKWPKERKHGYFPETEPGRTWHWMLRNGVRMPRTAAHIARHFRKKSKGPLDFPRGKS